MSAVEGGGIFISYRRQETSHLAGRLYDRLADRFGEGQVFIDVDAIELGVDFAEAISRAVSVCKVLLAVISPAWLTAADEHGRRRLDDPDDIVRLEIEAALARDVRVIPILVEGAVMPGRTDLPDSLAGLARRNALLMRHESFRSDAGRLVTAIEGVLAAPGTAEVPTALDTKGARSAGKISAEVAQQGPAPARKGPGAMYGRDQTTWEELIDVGLKYLIDVARHGDITSYSEFNDNLRSRSGSGFDFDLPDERGALGHLLGLIVRRTHPETNLMISALVTYRNSNDPGPGFYRFAQDLGLLKRGANNQMKTEFWSNQVRALHAYYS